MSDVTLTLGELIASTPAMRALGTYNIPNVKASYALAKIQRQAGSELELAEAERIKLCAKHAKKDNDGNPVILPPDAINLSSRYDFIDPAAYQADYASLMASSVVLLGCRALTLDELEGASQVIRDPEDPKSVTVVHGVTSELLIQLGPLVVAE